MTEPGSGSAYATAADVEVYFGPVPDDQVGRVERLLGDAEAELRLPGNVPDLDGRVGDGRTAPNMVTRVLAEMVSAFLRNPEGYRSMTRSATRGPFSEARSGTFASDASGGRLEVTRRHLELLGVVAVRAKGGGGSTMALADSALARPLRSPEHGDRTSAYRWPAPVSRPGELPTP